MRARPASSPVRVRDSFLVFGQPLIEEAEIAEVADSMRKGWLGTGPKVSQFERDFAAYKGVPQAVALGSCTAALHLALIVAGVRPGDDVVVPSFSFIATTNAPGYVGANPVFADVDAAYSDYNRT